MPTALRAEVAARYSGSTSKVLKQIQDTTPLKRESVDSVFADEKPAKNKPVVGGTRLLDPKTKQVLKVLVTRAYPVTLDTILRKTDVRSKMAVHKHIEAIRNAGYNVETITTGRKKRKYKLGA